MLEAVIGLWVALVIFGIVLWLQHRAMCRLDTYALDVASQIGDIIRTLQVEQACTKGLMKNAEVITSLLEMIVGKGETRDE